MGTKLLYTPKRSILAYAHSYLARRLPCSRRGACEGPWQATCATAVAYPGLKHDDKPTLFP